MGGEQLLEVQLGCMHISIVLVQLCVVSVLASMNGPCLGPMQHQQHMAEGKYSKVCAHLPCIVQVKAVLRPLYDNRRLSKDQFKDIARSAAHALRDPASQGCSAVSTVRDLLTAAGLSEAAATL